MHVDVLIIGQGLSGTFLSWNLFKEGRSFLVIDDGANDSASKIAAGIINPVTGRRYVTTWMIEELMEFAQIAYKELEAYFNTQLLFQKSIIDFFPSPQMRNAFIERIGEDDTYLNTYPDQNSFNEQFTYDFGCGEVRPVYLAHVQLLLELWRKKLEHDNTLLHERFDVRATTINDDFVSYNNIVAQKIIFCDGIASAQNPWFSLLPFSANKGETLIIECKELSDQHIFKKGMMLTPLFQPNTYWLGSSYEWDFENTNPSTKFYKTATDLLNNWLKKPYKVLAHKAAVRPATLERKPFVGFHPLYPNVGILNGMGTKGTSLAPFFARQLGQHIIHNFPLAPEADVKRFNRILSK